MAKKKSKWYFFRISIWILIITFLSLYFVIPSLFLNRLFFLKKAEDLWEKNIDNSQLSIGSIKWNSLADFSIQNTNISFYDKKKKKWKEKIHIGEIHSTLPPEAYLTKGLPFTKNNLSFFHILSKSINASHDSIKIDNASFDLNGFIYPLLFSKHNIDPFLFDFTGKFFIENLSFDSNKIRSLKGTFSNVPEKYLYIKGTVLWEKASFTYVIKASHDKSEIYATGKNIDLQQFVSNKIVTDSLFRTNIIVKLRGNNITSFSAILDSQDKGTVENFDFYSIISIIPQDQRNNIKNTLDSFQKYEYANAQIKFIWENSVFFTDYHFFGNLKGDERHITIPLHTDSNFSEFMERVKIDIFPVFSKELNSIIRYLK
ncbi:MAG: hypothetical protein KAI43_08120 [Candidatus Aureabacteria bacterium]|nr:hypothetical protein [Candidatus Auribacterota bacterium]